MKKRYQIRPTVLFSKNIDVNGYNLEELAKLGGESSDYIGEDVIIPKSRNFKSDTYSKALNEVIPKTLTFKVGAQVMLKYNIDVEGGFCNGSRGVVVELAKSYVTVKFLSGKTLMIVPMKWEIIDSDGKAYRTQIPLILGWALSIHKSQSVSLDFAVCDLGKSIFTSGQAYVAASRVRSIEGLFLSGLDQKSFKANSEALNFVKTIPQKRHIIYDKVEDEEGEDAIDTSVIKRWKIENGVLVEIKK